MLLFVYFSACSMKKIQIAAFGVPENDMNPDGAYRPRISPEHLRHLWKMKQESNKPKTTQQDISKDSLDVDNPGRALELNPHGLFVGAFNLVLTGEVLDEGNPCLGASWKE